MKEMNRRTRKDSDVSSKISLEFIFCINFYFHKKYKSTTSTETPDFIFKYADTDTLGEELAEWYTYSEEPEFLWNMKSFKENLNKRSS